ncbi:MAG TPA: RNA-guided endonuclease TnpB family protein [Roseiflexaceae bacterium]
MFEYRMRPNRAQAAALFKVLVASRRLYNDALAEWKAHFEATGKYRHIYEQDKRYNKTTYPDVPAVVTDQVIKRLHLALTAFFKGRKQGRDVGFPRFKPAQRWNSIEFRNGPNLLDGRYFKAPKQCGGRIRVNVHRPLEGQFRFARIVKRPSGWYLQCVCAVEPKPLPPNDRAVGLDMGITYLVADSDGVTTENPRAYKRSIERLAKAQRVVSRRVKGSRRRQKATRNVARIHEKIANQRKDVLHRVSRNYVNQYQTIVIEDLQPANMVKNHSLAQAISDSSWGMLRPYLTYKAAEAGREIAAVPPRFTSQKCSRCGEYVQKSLSVRTHICPHCGFIADRDVNAAINIVQARTGPSRKVQQ